MGSTEAGQDPAGEHRAGVTPSAGPCWGCRDAGGTPGAGVPPVEKVTRVPAAWSQPVG